VRFLIPKGLGCTSTRKYEVPSLQAWWYGTMDNTFVSAEGNLSGTGCSRIRVFDLPYFAGTVLGCRYSTGWCPTTLDYPPVYMNQQASSWRAVYNE
jgi:hypothetical protein